MKLTGELLRFGVVGTVGFVIDASVLQILVSWFGFGLLIGRVFSYLAAATASWFLHRIYTFRKQLPASDAPSASSRVLIDQWVRFVIANGIGASLNYGIYAICVLNSELCRTYPILGVAIGSVIAMVINFALSKRFVFIGSRRS